MDLIEDCINSIYRFNDLEDKDIEIIIVDNSGDFGFKEISDFVTKHYDNQVKLIQNDNRGYGQGNNVGVIASSGEIIVIMNPDVRLTEPVFRKTLDYFKNKKTGSVGYQQIGGQNLSYFIKPEFFLPIISSFQIKLLNKLKIFKDKTFALSGAFVFFRKEDFINAGMYDENMFMYFEEADISNRLRNIGKVSVFDPQCSYIHLMEQKDSYNKKLLDIGSQSIKIYFQKHNFNLSSYLDKRLLELKIQKIYCTVFGKKERIKMINAYIESLNEYCR